VALAQPVEDGSPEAERVRVRVPLVDGLREPEAEVLMLGTPVSVTLAERESAGEGEELCVLETAPEALAQRDDESVAVTLMLSPVPEELRRWLNVVMGLGEGEMLRDEVTELLGVEERLELRVGVCESTLEGEGVALAQPVVESVAEAERERVGEPLVDGLREPVCEALTLTDTLGVPPAERETAGEDEGLGSLETEPVALAQRVDESVAVALMLAPLPEELRRWLADVRELGEDEVLREEVTELLGVPETLGLRVGV
jgi:hypothetical protein